MLDNLISFLNAVGSFGAWSLPWWGYILWTLAATHLTIVCVTVFLHRAQAHRSLVLAPPASHVMRFWLWLTTGMVTKEWVAIHRKHHNKVETEDDPHSPRHWGLHTVLFRGADLYRDAATDKEMLNLYGQGTPDDWMEKHIYTKHSTFGIVALFIINYILFGLVGVAIWAVQMMWIPVFAAGIINGAGHAIGYRNFDTPDDSTNIGNVGLIIGGEELHNNHHAYPGSAKLSIRPWEFDVGWMYITMLKKCGLAEVKRVAPVPQPSRELSHLDLATVKMLLHSRLHVMSEYMNTVMQPVFHAELKKAKQIGSYHCIKRVKKIFLRHENRACPDAEHANLKDVLSNNIAMHTVYEFKHRLQVLWYEHRNDHEKLKEALHDWCHQAEASGMEVLQSFAARMRGYTLRDPLPV